MATTDNFAMNTSLPFYPGENVTGAVLTLSQNPCNNPYKRNACCTPTHKAHNAHGHISYTCANWTGADATLRSSVPRCTELGACIWAQRG